MDKDFTLAITGNQYYLTAFKSVILKKQPRKDGLSSVAWFIKWCDGVLCDIDNMSADDILYISIYGTKYRLKDSAGRVLQKKHLEEKYDIGKMFPVW